MFETKTWAKVGEADVATDWGSEIVGVEPEPEFPVIAKPVPATKDWT
jgi:hypothetical protein